MSARLLGEATVGSIVKLNLGGVPTDFIVVNQGIPQNDTEMYDVSCNGTWVLMQDIYNLRQWNDTADNDYNNSDINAWLNNGETGFLSLLDADIVNALPLAKIPTSSGTGASGLLVKAFLPSIKEIGFVVGYPYTGSSEGSVLEYFSQNQNSKRIAYYSGNAKEWLLRNWYRLAPTASKNVGWVEKDGSLDSSPPTDQCGIRPAMILPSDWYFLDNGYTTPNIPPTAPGSIEVTNVVIGESATIALTAATDPDGTIASYIFERQVDGGEEWVQISQTSSLTCQDPVSEDWGTVAYRACAVDDKGVAGEYVTSETFEVNAGWIVVSGPGENLGDKPGPFDFAFSLSVTGSTGAQPIHYSAALDGVTLDSGSAAPGQPVTLSLDTRLMATGPHSLSIAASAELFVPAHKVYTFSVPAVELPDGGRATQFKNSQGKALFPITLGRLVIGPGGVDFNTLFGRQTDRALQLAAGSYTGTGTSGAEAPTRLVFGFVPSLVLVTPGAAAAPALIWCGQSGGDSLTFAQQGSALSWYASSPAAQLNESSTEYHYLALGRKEDAE